MVLGIFKSHKNFEVMNAPLAQGEEILKNSENNHVADVEADAKSMQKE